MTEEVTEVGTSNKEIKTDRGSDRSGNKERENYRGSVKNGHKKIRMGEEVTDVGTSLSLRMTKSKSIVK